MVFVNKSLLQYFLVTGSFIWKNVLMLTGTGYSQVTKSLDQGLLASVPWVTPLS